MGTVAWAPSGGGKEPERVRLPNVKNENQSLGSVVLCVAIYPKGYLHRTSAIQEASLDAWTAAWLLMLPARVNAALRRGVPGQG